MYRPLLSLNTHDQIDYRQSIASGITTSHNDTVYTISLNPKWRWSNGTPVTAADVVYTWDIIKAASQPNAPWTYCEAGTGGVPTLWKSVTPKNAHTVVITTTKPVNPLWFEYNGIGQLFPIPKATWDKYSNMTQELSFIQSMFNAPKNPVYRVIDGPYNVGKVVNDEYYTMVANPHYVGRKPTIQKLVFEDVTSDASEWAALRKGVYADANVPTEYNAVLRQLPAYYTSWRAPVYDGFYYINPNLSNQAPGGMGPIFRLLYVRQALEMGINQPAIVKDEWGGLAVQSWSPVPRSTPFYDQALKNPYPYNPEKGKRLLEAHGWHLVNGVMTKNGKRLAFQFLVASGSAVDTNIAQLIVADWAKEGIKATIKEEPFNQVSAATKSQFQIEWWDYGWGYGGTYPTGEILFECNSGANYSFYCSSTMDRLIAQTESPQTPAQAQAAMNAYQTYAAKQLPVLYLPTGTNWQVTKRGLDGVQQTSNFATGYVGYNRWAVAKR